MALAHVYYDGDGAQVDFTVPFNFLNSGHLVVTVDDVAKVETTDWTLSGSTMTFLVAPPSGTDNVFIQRVTPVSARIVDFVNGGGVNESVLDTDSNQLFYILQEQEDVTLPLPTGAEEGYWLKAGAESTFAWTDLFGGANTWTNTNIYTGAFQVDVAGSVGQGIFGSDLDTGVAARLKLFGENSINVDTDYVELEAHVDDGTSTSEDGHLEVHTYQAGVSAKRALIGLGMALGSETDPGTLGWLNATGLEIGGTDIFAKANTWSGVNIFTATNGLIARSSGAAGAIVVASDVSSGNNVSAIGWEGHNSAAADKIYSRLWMDITDNTAGSEDAKLRVQNAVAGSDTNILSVGAGMWMEGATGSDPGAGKINCTEIQVNGVAVSGGLSTYTSAVSATTKSTDHVFAHGLGVEPELVSIILECTADNNGYVTGERLYYSPAGVEDVTTGVRVKVDATNVTVWIPSTGFRMFVDGSTSAFNHTVAQWDMEVRAYA